MITLEEARQYVATLLDLVQNDSDAVAASLRASQRRARQFEDYTSEQDDNYTMYRLALSDLTGQIKYRGCR